MIADQPLFDRTKPLVAAVLALSLTFSTSPAFANPKGAEIKAGQITIEDLPGLMTITQGDLRGIIHWQDFSIDALETTRFVQPDAGAATLNRVVGGVPSNIHGALEANGHVFLINPNGVLVGPGGRVNTAGFVASSLDVPDAEFLAGGDMTFSGPSLAGVVNLGIITASSGDVVLMARSVENAGTISAPNGTAALAAGNEILLQPAGEERVVVKSAVAGGGNGVTNSGTIEAAQAELKAAGGNVYALAVNNSGIVRATGLSKTKSGRIILSAGAGGGAVMNTGQLIAKNSDGSGGKVKLDGGVGGSATNEGTIDAKASDATKPGGTVEILGDTVTVGNGSVIDVSGSEGGLVAIGVPAEVAAQATAAGGIATLAAASGAPTAQQAAIQANSRILANAATAGDGGKIVVWSEQQSTLGGVFEAQGGTLEGDGGLVETSGRLGLNITPGTRVSASAPNGRAGTWLLDPAGVQINANPSDITGPAFTQNANVNTVNAGDILIPLAAGTNVSIQTTNAFPAANRDIVVDAAIPLLNTNPAVTLSLLSAGGISINESIGGTGAPLTVNAVASGGDIAFGTNGTIVANLAVLRSSGHIFDSSGGTRVTANQLLLQSGPQGIGSPGQTFGTSVGNLEALVGFSPTPPAGSGVYIENTGVATLNIGGVDPGLSGVQVPINAAYGDIFITTTGSLLLGDAGGDRVTGPNDIGLFAGGDLKIFNSNVNGIRSHFGAVSLSSGGLMDIGDFATSRNGHVRGALGVNLNPSGVITVRSGSSVTADGTSDIFLMGGSDVLLDGNVQTNGGDVTIFAAPGADFAVSNAGINTTLNPSDHGDIFINADKVDLLGPINAGTGDVTFLPIAGTRSVDLGTNTAGKLSLTGAELGRVTAANLNIETGSVGGDIAITAPINGLNIGALGLTAAGRVDFNAGLNLGTHDLVVLAQQGIGGLSAANLTANAATLIGGIGPISLAGPLQVSQLGFNSLDFASFGNASNNIGAIGNSEAGAGLAGFSIVDGAGNLTINGDLVSNGALNEIKVAGGHFVIDPGASITAPSLQIDVSNGNFINSGGPNAIIIGGLGRLVVYESDPFAPHNKGGLLGLVGGLPVPVADYTSAPVKITDANNDPLGVGSIFYYAALSVPAPPPPPPTTLQKGKNNSGGAPVRNSTTDQLLSNLTQRVEWETAGVIHQSVTSNLLEREKAAQKARETFIAEQQQAILDALYPMSLSSADLHNLIWGGTRLNGFQITSLSPAQIRLLEPAQIKRMLILEGAIDYRPSATELISIKNAKMSPEQFGAMVKASGGELTSGQFATMVAAGAGNLTLNQMVAAGAGNLVAVGGLNLKVLDRDGKLVSSNAGNLTFFELAKLIGQDGGSLVGNSGNTLIGQDGGSLIGQDGGSLVGNSGNTFLENIASLIGQDGGSLVGNSGNTLSVIFAAMIGMDGGSMIGLDGGSLQQAIAAMAPTSASSLISRNASEVMSHNGGAMIDLNQASLVPPTSAGSMLNFNYATGFSGNSGNAFGGFNGNTFLGSGGFNNPAIK